MSNETPSQIFEAYLPSNQVLRTFPSGWTYYAEADAFEAQSIEDIGKQLGFVRSRCRKR